MSNRFYNFLVRLVPGTVAKSADVNNIIDGIVGGLDEVEQELNRAIKLPEAESGSEHNLTEDAEGRAGKLLRFDASGNPVVTNVMGDDVDMDGHALEGLPFAEEGDSPVTLDQLNAFAGSLAGLPAIVGQSGKYLASDGTTVYWATIPAIPAQEAGTAGKFLMSDGASASWEDVPDTIPSSTESGVALVHNGASYSFVVEGANLIVNPLGVMNYGGTIYGWTVSSSFMSPTSAVGLGPHFASGNLSANSGNVECANFAFPGSAAFAFSAEVDAADLTGGSLSLVVDFRNGADASISTSTQAVTAGVRRRYRVTGTTPATTAYIRVRLVGSSATSVGPIRFIRPKLEAGSVATPFNDHATTAYLAAFRATTEVGRGFASAILRVGDASSTTGAQFQARSAAGAQAYDFRINVTGGTNGTVGRATAAMECKSFSNTGAIGYASEYDNGNSGAAKTVDFGANGSRQRITMTDNCNITLAGMTVVGQYRVKVIQNGTGNFTPTFAGVPITWAGSDAPDAQAANGVTFVDFYYDGATAWGSWTPWS
jgi:hypothetical protein